MNEKNIFKKGLILPIVLGVILILIIVGGIYIYIYKVHVESRNVDLDNKQEVIPNDLTVENTNIKSFKLGTLEFEYPDNLSFSALEKKGEGVVHSISHFIPYKHVNSCDLKDGLSLDDLTDFGVTFELYNLDLKNSIKKDNMNMLEYIFKGDSIITETGGFVDKYKIGVLDGYKITVGVEGCGFFTYYFPISVNETLVVRRDVYLQTFQIGREKLSNIPGFITQQEEQIFNDILSSVKGVSLQPETMTIKVFFGDTIDAQSCHTPSYVERIIPKTTAVARAAIEELLKGPNEAEKLQDYWTGLRPGISIKSISIENGVALLDLSSTLSLNDANRGTCGASIIIKQIENTLKQFSTIKSVVIKVNGQPAENSIDP